VGLTKGTWTGADGQMSGTPRAFAESESSGNRQDSGMANELPMDAVTPLGLIRLLDGSDAKAGDTVTGVGLVGQSRTSPVSGLQADAGT